MAVSLTNDIFQTVRVAGGSPQHLGAHLDVAATALQKVFGPDTPAPDRKKVEALIARSAQGPNCLVRLWFDPRGGVEAEASGPLLYPGYVLWHSQPEALAAPYGNFLGELPCRTTLLYAAHAEGYATAHDFGAALHIAGEAVHGLAAAVWCGDGEIGGAAAPDRTGVGEWPVFCLARAGETTRQAGPGGAFGAPAPAPRVICTSPMDSVERRLGLAALARLGIETLEKPLPAAELAAQEEIFALTPQGVVALQGWDGMLYFSLIAGRVAAAMSRISLP